MKYDKSEKRGPGVTATTLGILTLCLLGAGCDSDSERARLEDEGVGRLGQPAVGQEPGDSESPVNPPDEHRRTDFELDSERDLEVDVRLEEVTAGLRIEVQLEDAEPGKYDVLIHIDGSCVRESSLGSAMSLAAGEKEGESPAENAIGQIELDEDGQARARWLTARGNLRPGENHSVLDRPFAIYRADDRGLGERVACGKTAMN